VLTKMLVLAICFLMPLPSVAQMSKSLESRLSSRVTDYDLGTTNSIDALLRVGSEFQIPMGITWIKSPGEIAESRFRWKQATVQEVIESIVGREPGHRVKIDGGVVHVIPLGSIPDDQNFLKLRIRQFDVPNGSIDMALLKLHELINPSRHNGFSVGAEPGESRVTLKLRDSTVSDILDALALGSGRKIWLTVFSNNPNPTAAGFRRTLTPWIGFSPVLDGDEPALNLLHWGDKITPQPARRVGNPGAGAKIF